MTDENKNLDPNIQTQTFETEEEKEVRRELAFRNKMKELKKDEAMAEMLKAGLEDEIKNYHRPLNGEAWDVFLDIKKKEYAKKVLEKLEAEKKSEPAPVNGKAYSPSPAPAADPKDGKTFSPKEKTDAELSQMGWSKLEIAQYRAFPV